MSNDEDQEEIERLWALEAEDRIAAYDRGEIEAIPGEEFLASLKRRGRNITPGVECRSGGTDRD